MLSRTPDPDTDVSQHWYFVPKLNQSNAGHMHHNRMEEEPAFAGKAYVISWWCLNLASYLNLSVQKQRKGCITLRWYVKSWEENRLVTHHASFDCSLPACYLNSHSGWSYEVGVMFSVNKQRGCTKVFFCCSDIAQFLYKKGYYKHFGLFYRQPSWEMTSKWAGQELWQLKGSEVLPYVNS